ncbi:MAG: GGDEF domain-containing protein, partial [Gammaproteobacteria bacterium]|nr:GGDEF domain-containing protein [Gammaproteobacteria bacterium]
MRVPGLHTSDLAARSADRARQPLLVCTIVAGSALAMAATGVLALGSGRGTASGLASGMRGASLALNALFGLSVLLIALLVLQFITRRRYESALEGTIRRQSRLLQEISAISTMVELLQTCHSQAEANTVIHGALPKLLPGVGGALYVSRRDDAALELQVDWGPATASQGFSAEDCWALRRGRPHLYDPASAAAVCRHIGDCEDSCLCVPLVSQGDTLAVLQLRGTGGGSLAEDVQRLASALAEQLSLAVGNLRLQETLRSGSERDPLTDLYNRRHLEISLQRELARAMRHGFPVSLIMIDVDHFKAFNDNNGHDAGDEVLRNVAHVLKRHTRAEDVACRYGGEEFLVVLPSCAMDDAYSKAEAIREAIAQLHVFSRGIALPRMTASLGIACYPEDGERMED